MADLVSSAAHVRRLWARPARARLYTGGDRIRSRRATDVVLLAGCLAAGLTVLAVADPPSGFEVALIDLADSVPGFLDVVWRLAAAAQALWVAWLVVAALVRGRLLVVRDQVLAVAVALVVVRLLDAPLGGGRPIGSALVAGGPPSDPVSARLALAVAVLSVASPHLARPFRTTGRWLTGGGALALVILEATTPTGAVLGILVGAGAAATVHLALGSSGGRPSEADVESDLAELGVVATELRARDRQQAGVFVMDGRDDQDRQLVVKVYGRDAWDAQLLAKGWRALWYRDTTALTLTRLQQAEQEGFVTLLAERSGVPVNDVVRAGRTAGGDALIALHADGEPLAAGAAADDVLDSLWDAVAALSAAGFAHGDLGPGRFRVADGRVVIDDLAGASVAPSDDGRRVDVAQLVVTVALLADVDRAVAMASDRLGAERLAEVVPYLQVAALGPRLRSEVNGSDLDVDALRSRAAEAAGVDEPSLARLRRVSTATLVQAALLALAAYVLITTVSGVDTQQLAEILGAASIPILIGAVAFGQLPRLSQAEATRAACPRPLAYGPVLMLQFAITFVNLVIPSTAARVAVNIRFFQRQGIPPAAAVSVGAIDGFGGFVVQVSIILAVLVFGAGDVDIDLGQATDGSGHLLDLLAIALGVVLVAVVVVLVVPALRRRIVARVAPWVDDARQTLATLRSPATVARILGANLGAEVLFASTLGIVLLAFDASLPLATLLVINVTVALFAGLMPVPGGIGVSEGALVVGLTGAGIDQATALAAAISYRICTFYLPPLWGGVAFHRLERAGYL